MNISRSHSSVLIQEGDLPCSKMVFPLTMLNRLKYGLWRVYTPLHPFVRDSAIALKIVTPPAQRQNFLIGRLSSDVSVEAAAKHLVSKGYGNHFIAWEDDGQAVSLRRLVSFEHQYHVRIFADGEVRGHYEYTPECYPILHYKGISQEARTDEFLQLFGDMIIK